MQEVSKTGKKDKLYFELSRALYSFRGSPVFVLVLMQLAAIAFVGAKGAGNIYLDMVVILILITLLSWFLTSLAEGNHKLLVYAVILLTVGTMLQSIFLAEDILKNPEKYGQGNPAAGLQLQYLVAMAAAAAAGFGYRYFKKMSSLRVCQILYLITVFLSVMTLALAVGVGGVKNWIIIGGFSFQTTEITKFLYVLIAAGLLATVEKPDRKRILAFYLVTLTDMAFLAVQGEFGTLLLVLFMCLTFLFLFVGDIRILAGTVGCLAAGGFGIFALGSWLGALRDGGSALGMSAPATFFLNNYAKIANRCIYWLHPEKDALGLGYQLLKARESILLGGWFGTSSITALPVKSSDLVYPALIQRCGMVFAILIFIVFILLWQEGEKLYLRKADRYHQAVGAGFIYLLFYQTVIIIAGSTGLCPLTGITLPLISSGGSSLMVTFMMLGILVSLSGNTGPADPVDKKSLLKRTKVLQSASLICVMLMVLSLIRISAILPGVSKEADKQKKEATAAAHEREYTRGAIEDRDGERLAWSEEPLGKRQYLHPKAFSNVLGYWSRIYGTYGLEKTLNADLTYSKSEKDDKRGADVRTTLDSSLQKTAYRLMKDQIGSVVVLDAKTGEILALVSTPTYDLEKLEDNWEKVNEAEGVLLSNAYQNPVTPGSVFKLITSKAILEEGIEDETVEDTGALRVNGQTIRNYNGKAYGTISFEEGFVKSSNVYFMDRTLKMGGRKLEKAAQECLLGQKIPLDFTTLRSTFDLGDYEDNKVASTAFGQGETLVTPLQMAMITQSIAAGGTMMEPYLIQSITSGGGEQTYLGEQEVLATTMDPATAAGIADAMVKAGESYDLPRVGSQDARIAAKTGTAERGDGSNNAWFVSFAPADDPQYVIVANKIKTDAIGKTLAPVVTELYEQLLP